MSKTNDCYSGNMNGEIIGFIQEHKEKRFELGCLMFVSFVISFAILAIAYYEKDIYPEGANTVLTSDLGAQYMPFWAYLRYLGENDSSIFFSPFGALGNNFYGYAYYGLFDPSIWVTALFPLEQLPDVIYFITLVKIGLCGAGFCYYLWYTYGDKRHRLAMVLLSCCYALMSFNVGYALNMMWLSGVLMLPWILVGEERILKEKKPIVFIVSIAVSMICNYYITFMSVIFATLYMIIRSLETGNLEFGKLFRWVECLLVGVGMSMPVVLPGVLGLISGKLNEESKPITHFFRYRLIDVVRQLLSGRYDTLFDDGLPLIFCGTGTLVLVVLYFIKADERFGQKLLWMTLIAFYLFSMCFIPMDRIMHGLKETTCFETRYSYVFSCLLLILAYRGADCLYNFVFDLSLLTLIRILIVCFVLGELYFNTSILIAGIMSELHYGTSVEYSITLDEKRKTVEYIDDDDFYRISDYAPYTYNDGAWLGFSGIGYSSSCYNLGVMDFFGAIGEDQSVHVMLDGMRTPLEESLLGAKYRISYSGDVRVDNPLVSGNLYTLSKNDDALSIGYMTGLDNDSVVQKFGKDALCNQNIIAKELAGIEDDVFVEIEPSKCDELNSEEYNSYHRCLYKMDCDASVWAYCEKGDANIYYNNRNTNLIVNGQDMGCFIDPGSESSFILFLGKYNKDERMDIDILSNADYKAFHVYYMDDSIYNRVIEILQTNMLELTEHYRGHFRGWIHAGDGGKMMISLPYMNGWSIRVDGIKTEYDQYRDSLIIIPLSEGKHEIDIDFVSPGFYVGLIIGLLSMLLFVRINVINRREMTL